MQACKTRRDQSYQIRSRDQARRKKEAWQRARDPSLPPRVGQDLIRRAAKAAALFLMSNTNTTGIVLDVDGGHMIRQYAQM